MPFTWSAEHLKNLKAGPDNIVPILGYQPQMRILQDQYLWDFWPVQTGEGAIAKVDDHEIWMALSASAHLAPGKRHQVARIRLLAKHNESWFDRGTLFPDGFSLGSYEWTGSATLDASNGRLSLYYTAVGLRDESRPSYVQRLVQVTGCLQMRGDGPAFGNWSEQEECVSADGTDYAIANQSDGEPGFIRAFRDPYLFMDRITDTAYLIFSASIGQPRTSFSGAIGIAEATDLSRGLWRLKAPLVQADGVNNELERAHAIVYKGRYYVFWSTQSRTFHPACSGPNGLYGVVGKSLKGPFRPLNGSGLVLANPSESPTQCYAWLVLEDLRVISFLDTIKTPEPAATVGEPPVGEEFVGSMAPVLRLSLDGERACLVRGEGQT